MYVKFKFVNFLDLCGEYLYLRLVFFVLVGIVRILDKDIIFWGFWIFVYVRE